jgi:hypothetical protein
MRFSLFREESCEVILHNLRKLYKNVVLSNIQ